MDLRKKVSSGEERSRALGALVGGMSVGVVAACYGVNRSTLWRWRAALLRGQGLEPGCSPGGERKIGPEQESALLAQLRAHSDATIDEHLALWRGEQGQQVSRATMGRAIQRLGWTRKKRA